MKIIHTISFKMIVIIVLISAFLIGNLTYFNYKDQMFFYEDLIVDQAADFGDVLESFVMSILSDKPNNTINETHKDKIYDIISNFSKHDKKIYQIDIILPYTLPAGDKEFRIFVSSDINNTNITYEHEDLIIRCMNLKTKIFETPDFSRTSFSLIGPLRLINSNAVIGCYGIKYSYEEEAVQIQEILTFAVSLSIFILTTLILCLIYLLRRYILKPLIIVRDNVKVFGKGKLDIKININSRDELGDLATTFNQMADDLKESRDKIHEYNRILENLLKQKDEFIGQLGHDLKNPLQPLVGLLPMLISKEKDPELKEALNIMNQNVEYMRNLIMKTLELAKLRSSDINFDIENIKLRSEADDAISSQSLLLKKKNILVENKINNEFIVKGDKLRLIELFKNLISNAIKFIPDRGGKIVIDAEKKDRMVVISVKDNGIGMRKEQIDKIFDEFYKADKFSSNYYSTGLGLAICKRIVEKMGGEIWVESLGAGQGSTFYFTLEVGGNYE